MKALRVTTVLSAILAGVSVVWLTYNLVMVSTIYSWMDESATQGDWIFYGTAYSFVAHILVLAWIVHLISSLRPVSVFASMTLVAGIVSTVFFLNDFACIHDIGKQHAAGHAFDLEVRWLLIGYLVHGAFLACLLMTYLRALPFIRHDLTDTSSNQTETLFIAMNVSGALCAAIGFVVLLVQYDVKPLTAGQQKLLVFIEAIFVVCPYALIAEFWLWRAYRNASLMDEKQKSDVNKAGVTTWILSLPLMLALFAVNYNDVTGPASIIWFPYYLFITMFTFSVSSLWYFHRA